MALFPLRIPPRLLAIWLIHNRLIRHGRNIVLIDMFSKKRVCWERINVGEHVRLKNVWSGDPVSKFMSAPIQPSANRHRACCYLIIVYLWLMQRVDPLIRHQSRYVDFLMQLVMPQYRTVQRGAINASLLTVSIRPQIAGLIACSLELSPGGHAPNLLQNCPSQDSGNSSAKAWLTSVMLYQCMFWSMGCTPRESCSSASCPASWILSRRSPSLWSNSMLNVDMGPMTNGACSYPSLQTQRSIRLRLHTLCLYSWLYKRQELWNQQGRRKWRATKFITTFHSLQGAPIIVDGLFHKLEWEDTVSVKNNYLRMPLVIDMNNEETHFR